MELNTYFSMLVLSICTMHLASNVGDKILMRWWSVDLVRNFLFKSAGRDYVPASSGIKTKQRSDWFVFFHCADLIGKEASSTSCATKNAGQNIAAPKEKFLRRGVEARPSLRC